MTKWNSEILGDWSNMYGCFLFEKSKMDKKFYTAFKNCLMNMSFTKTDGGLTRIVDCDKKEIDDDGIEKINVNVELPLVLKMKIFKNEEAVNLLQVATIIYNNDIEANPPKGFGKIIFFLKDEKFDYDFRVHSISFNPTLDLDNTHITAVISTTDNKMINRLVQDGIIQFFLSGKLIQKNNGEVDTVVITKIVPRVDQTVYAKKYKAAQEKKNALLGLPDEFGIKNEVWKPDIINPDKISEAWGKYCGTQTKKVKADDKPLSQKTKTDIKQEDKPLSQFEAWRKRFKAINKKIDNFIKS